MVMLRVTGGGAAGGGAAAAAADTEEEEEEGEKEAYLRSLPRPESGRGPATVSSHSWSRRPMHHQCSFLRPACVVFSTCVRFA